jgi:hypothetical protein
VARAPGYQDYAEQVQIAEGERRTLQLNLIPLPAEEVGPASPAAAPTVQSPKPESKAAVPARTYVLAGEAAVTVAALGVGVGFWLAQSSAADRIDRIQGSIDQTGTTCRGTPGETQPENCSQLSDAINDHDDARRFSTWGFAGAGAGAAATILTFLLWPSGTIAPSVQAAASGTWLGVDGRF